MGKMISTVLLALSFIVSSQTLAQTVPAPQMTPKLWSQFSKGVDGHFLIEFRQGDIIPVRLTVQGDFLESTKVGTTYITVKRTFWLRLQNNVLQASLDGSHFEALNQLVTGSFTAGGWQETGPINMINLALQAYMK